MEACQIVGMVILAVAGAIVVIITVAVAVGRLGSEKEMPPSHSHHSDVEKRRQNATRPRGIVVH
ncbi:OLC1v1023387C1 [Oldenlandia corymbosa var. corymbosa]|uniref:OLC1v1023387C1 n=1 Tax=Oldenlandia corymbosa var. corymbosa TaxID=529605 RepID=A0AAV1C0I6_OLDCO|nr:OLC1v1023387C1 [Oldenlandia corymbosa var. corymbosa]